MSESIASFVVLSLRNALGVPSAKLPIDGTTFASYVFPPLVCSFVVALLAVTPHTRAIRIALWPPIAFLSLRAALSVDASLGRIEQKNLDITLVASMSMFFAAARTLEWALPKGPLVRHLRPANSSRSTIMDTLDLVSNIRGHGWTWSGGLYMPRETRPTDRKTFVLCALLSAIAHSMICGAIHRAILTLAPVGVGPIPQGSTIFDDSLPFLVRYLRSSIITTLAGWMMYTALQMNYDSFTILSILLLGQEPVQWPPLFDAPWRATSLTDFWGRRWHQLLRRTFLFLGGYPLSRIFGRVGVLVGAFLVSAIIHHFIAITFNSKIEIWWMLVGFGMMIPGILAERVFYRLTGKRVCGVLGWMWTMTWLTLWSHLIIEGYARGGMFGCTNTVDSMLPVQISVDRLVADFDVWLHTI
ncbi:membrane bound O-acyl transferase family-domain-containing protein [Boletus edulis]|nr:membrane bound O-acyl transferase family-domain-containing protein [Boletus edulis]